MFFFMHLKKRAFFTWILKKHIFFYGSLKKKDMFFMDIKKAFFLNEINHDLNEIFPFLEGNQNQS